MSLENTNLLAVTFCAPVRWASLPQAYSLSAPPWSLQPPQTPSPPTAGGAKETSAGLQRFMNAVVSASLTVDGVISSQPSRMAPSCPGIVGGWEWVDGAAGSPTIQAMNAWLKHLPYNSPLWRDGTAPQGAMLFGTITTPGIKNLQEHYGITQDGRLDGPSQTIMALQNEINQYVG